MNFSFLPPSFVCYRFVFDAANDDLVLPVLMPGSKKLRIADFTGLPYQSVIFSLQKMSAKHLIEIEEIKLPKAEKQKNTPRQFRFTLLPDSEPIIEEIKLALSEYKNARLAGFTEEELVQYKTLNKKIKENIKKTLS